MEANSVGIELMDFDRHSGFTKRWFRCLIVLVLELSSCSSEVGRSQALVVKVTVGYTESWLCSSWLYCLWTVCARACANRQAGRFFSV